MSTTKSRRRWGVFFILLGIAGFLLWGSGMERQQNALAERVIRLHIVANSDSDADQSLKLQVRDRILDELSPQLLGISDAKEAFSKISAAIPALCDAGEEIVRQNGYGYPVTAAVEPCWFPSRDYGTFALPAGEYTALRVVIGKGGGQNWWCVVFPPLCMGVVSEPAEIAAAAGLPEGEISLIAGETEGCLFRFKSVELWESLKKRLQ